jgi:hypothetical protein
VDDGPFDVEAPVPAVLLQICRWWLELTADERAGLLKAAELAEIDRQIDAVVFRGPA